jgi:FlaA1/EpsC-like NDP-sugar epimerase
LGNLQAQFGILSESKTIEAMQETILVTGGAGFIGSNFILAWMNCVGTPLVNLDKLTYA